MGRSTTNYVFCNGASRTLYDGSAFMLGKKTDTEKLEETNMKASTEFFNKAILMNWQKKQKNDN